MTLTKRAFENIEGKGENAGNQHFLLFPLCFLSHQKQTALFEPYFSCRLQMLPVWTSLKFCCLVKSYLFTTQFRLLMTLKKKPFETIVGKGENAGNQHFLLFQQYFLPISKRVSVFKLHLFCSLQRLSVWTSLKMCRMVKS